MKNVADWKSSEFILRESVDKFKDTGAESGSRSGSVSAGTTKSFSNTNLPKEKLYTFNLAIDGNNKVSYVGYPSGYIKPPTLQPSGNEDFGATFYQNKYEGKNTYTNAMPDFYDLDGSKISSIKAVINDADGNTQGSDMGNPNGKTKGWYRDDG